jgi:hypothetical protein
MTDSTWEFLLEISPELGNDELFLSILNLSQGGLTVSNAVGRLHLATAVLASCDRVIVFLAAPFSEFHASDLGALSFDELALIVCRCDLELDSED